MATMLANSLRADRIGALRLREVCKAEPADAIEQVVRCMTERRSGCVLVHREGDLVGIFTERDFVNRVVTQGVDCARPVESVMTADPATVSVGDSVLAAIELMNAGGYRHLPVVGEDGQPIGVLTVKDIVHYLVQYFPAQVYNLPPTPDAYQPAREGA
jgi:CBS domain-containing protein